MPRLRNAVPTAVALMAALASPPAALPAPPPTSELVAAYDVYFGGLRAGELTVAASFGAGDYRADATFRGRGIIGLFMDTELEAETVGRLEAGALVPIRFRSLEREAGREKRRIEVTFTADRPQAVRAAPPFPKRPWSIDPRQQKGTTDPLSAIIALLLPQSPAEVCGQRLEAFDGRRRFAFDLEPAADVRGHVRCDGIYLRLAGFSPRKMKRDRARIPFTLHFRTRADGTSEVVRLVGDTRYGTVVMKLRR